MLKFYAVDIVSGIVIAASSSFKACEDIADSMLNWVESGVESAPYIIQTYDPATPPSASDSYVHSHGFTVNGERYHKRSGRINGVEF